MAFEDKLVKTSKLLTIFLEFSKLTGLVVLVLSGIATIVFPSGAKQRLQALGLQIAQIEFLGIKLVQAQTYNAADKLVDAKINLDNAIAGLAVTSGVPSDQKKEVESALSAARIKIAATEASLDEQGKAISRERSQSNTPTPDLPDTGWIFVGLLTEEGHQIKLPESRVDQTRLVIQNNQVSQLFLRYDAPVVDNGSECKTTRVEDYFPPPPSIHMLIRADPNSELKVIAAASCPIAGKGKQVYAQIKIPADRVRFIKFSD